MAASAQGAWSRTLLAFEQELIGEAGVRHFGATLS